MWFGIHYNVFIYNVLLLVCFLYALGRGGSPELIGATIFLVGSLLTRALRYREHDFQALEPALLALDLAVFVAFLLLAIASKRFWPIFVTGLQGATVMSHLPVTLGDRDIAFAYAVALALWSYPILLCIAIGTWRHHRRLRTIGHDPAWKPFVVRALQALRKSGPMA